MGTQNSKLSGATQDSMAPRQIANINDENDREEMSDQMTLRLFSHSQPAGSRPS
jgi:hypothetical protein